MTAKKTAKTVLRPSIRRNDRTGVTFIDAETPLDCKIIQHDIDRAVCRDPMNCVVGKALQRSQAFCDGFQVGPRITKLFSNNGKQVIRYSTPSKLAAALRTFDKTGVWGLEPGTYQLLPLSKSYRRANRWHKMRHSGGKQSTYRGTAVAPTRHAETIFQIAKKIAA